MPCYGWISRLNSLLINYCLRAGCGDEDVFTTSSRRSPYPHLRARSGRGDPGDVSHEAFPAAAPQEHFFLPVGKDLFIAVRVCSQR